jgi:hypothetical protein
MTLPLTPRRPAARDPHLAPFQPGADPPLQPPLLKISTPRNSSLGPKKYVISCKSLWAILPGPG